MTDSQPAGRLRVVHVITTLTTGGAERAVELLATKSVHDVRVVCLYQGGSVADGLRDRGIPVTVLGMDGWRKPAAVIRLAMTLRRSRPDLVHVHLLSAQLWGIPAGRLARVPVVLSTEHSLMDHSIEGRRKSLALRVLYLGLERLTTRTIAVSVATARRLKDWGVRPDHVMILSNPIDFETLARRARPERIAVRQSFGIPASALTLGAIGRLDDVKRFDQLIHALHRRMQEGAHLLLVGEGPRRDDLEALSDRLGVADAVHFAGTQPNIPSILDGIDVLVSPSRDETFGMAIIEAIGAGVPVVYASCPALDDLQVPSTTAIRVPCDTGPVQERRDLDDAVDNICRQGLHRRTLPEVVKQAYDSNATATRMDRLYEDLVKNRREAVSVGQR